MTACLLICSSVQPAGSKVSVTLLGYTNNTVGIPAFGYAGSNIVQSSGFALLCDRYFPQRGRAYFLHF